MTEINKKKLRGYIPLAAPLNWEPVRENESSLRTVLSFTTNWFTKRVGIDFSESYHTDPLFRFECLLKMKDYIRKTFPGIEYFREHDEDNYEQECATISGVFGVCFIAMIYGLEVIYRENDWPGISPDSKLTVEHIRKLEPFNLFNNPAVEQLFEQMEIINRKWGKIDGFLNYQGVLNNAFKLRGENIFMDMIDDPGFTHHLFGHITDTMIKLINMVQRRQRESGFYIEGTSTSNCLVNMISSRDYEKFILPYDIKMSESFDRFGIHSCNWVIDPYIEGFFKVKNLGYIDFGSASNLVRVKEVFPDVTREVFYNPAELLTKSEGDIRRDIRKIYDELSPCELNLSDIEVFIPDIKIIKFVEIASEVADEEQS